MTVLIVVAGLVLGMFTYEPSWFDTRPHYYSHTYENKRECQRVREILAKTEKGAVCTSNNALYLTK
ncbi:uncharacterized protein METZ01_LOCUS169426 [marine metagenome]|uniref:Uncharacterized protein n=1 Tax=marine metagenome TaxID=408172 RepID=A0A382BT12_9ZZZZ